TVWATTLKMSHGFQKLDYSIYTIIGMGLSFWLLAKAIKTLPLGIAYPIWTGIGALGTIILGVTLFGDRLSPLTWVFVGLLLISIIGIKITVH
ncbi:DMT family transporter, partial [Loigolactobacillus coryniformis]